ncbi:SPFH/Band 7/PHB domain protein [Candidatus Woesearchaeota archaeon]|nr:SPFH/Band 7/PHB domain protein [Candidatus Woesearchaeota archaeon]
MVYWFIGIVITVIFLAGIRIVRPVERGLIERLGKYKKFATSGFNWIIPVIDRMIKVNITERMVNAEPQEIITKDKLNARVDAQVYFKVKDNEQYVKDSQYNVFNYENQIVNLARTTLRNIIGTLTLNEANSGRDQINKELMQTLMRETKNWGIEVVRTELKEIDPPKDVQETMNKVVKAENEKIAAVDFATAKETQADGERRAAIKIAEGGAKAVEIGAKAKAEAIKLVNESADKYFKGNAQLLKQFEVTEESLKRNSKIILTEKGIQPIILFGEEKVVPIKRK